MNIIFLGIFLIFIGWISLRQLRKASKFFQDMRLEVRSRRDFSLLQKQTPETAQFIKGYQISDKWHMENEDILFSRIKEATDEERKKICKALRINEASGSREISKAYRAAAGHSFRKILGNDGQLSYQEILLDVAAALRPKTARGIFSWFKREVKKIFSKNQNSYVKSIEKKKIDTIEETIEKYFNERFQKQLNKRVSSNESQKKRDQFTYSEKKKEEEIFIAELKIGYVTVNC